MLGVQIVGKIDSYKHRIFSPHTENRESTAMHELGTATNSMEFGN